MRRILFVHPNFPGQFVHLARDLVRRDEWEVAAIGGTTAKIMPGLRLERYASPEATRTIEPLSSRFVLDVQRGEAVARVALELRASGFMPDVVMGHSGWGEMLFLRDVFPTARFISYLEFYFRAEGADVGFDPEFSADGFASRAALRARNASTLFAAADSDVLLTPTQWQAGGFPPDIARRLVVAHEGIDTDRCAPHAGVRLDLPNGRTVTTGDEIVTFVARDLEPYRGFHSFMRALPMLLRSRPEAQILIIGGDGVSYGAPHSSGRPWREVLLDEIGPVPGLDRVHFLGRVPYDAYIGALQLSRAHVYVTYPFVLSWSLLEAMSCGAPIVASRTAPVEEVVTDGENGRLVDFFDQDAIAEAIVSMLADPTEAAALGHAARRTVLERYDLARTCLPNLVRLVEG